MKRLSILLLFVCLMILGVLPVAGAESAQGQDKIATQKYVLDNGLTVLVSEIPASPVVSVYAFVKSGSATEGEILGSGITHFLEHMLFKGTQKRGVGVIAEEVQALGGVINAATSFDYTFFTATVPFEHFSKTLEIVSDMLQNPRFDPQEIQKEREVVFSEMRMYRDHPDHIFHRPRRIIGKTFPRRFYLLSPEILRAEQHDRQCRGKCEGRRSVFAYQRNI
jgi:zinc protease